MRHNERWPRARRSQRGEETVGTRSLPFGIAGAKSTLKRDGDGRLELMSIEIDGAPTKGARDDAPVWLIIPDFILWGGDALLEGVTCTPSAMSATRVRDAWRATLAREQACDGAPKDLVFERP